MILFVASAIVGGVVGVAVGTIIHIRRDMNNEITTYPTPVTMPDGSKRFLVGGGQLLFKAEEKEKEAGD